MKSEISELLAELKEQVLFMQELGVENLSVDLPEMNPAFQSSSIPNPKSQIPNPIERYVPTDLNLPKVSDTKPPNIVNQNASPNGILDRTKLSRLPSLSKREPIVRANQNQEIIKPSMPKKAAEEEKPQEILFEDFKQTLAESNETIEDIRADIGNCTRCPLHEGRTNIVHSTGNLQADLMFVGEAPGADEDAQGVPFVGRAGQLLNKIIEAIGMKREEVFIGNINRCRPPGNRAPTLPEAHTCKPFLLREIAIVRPKVIVVLGNTACQNLLETKIGITKLRGEFQDYYGVKVMPTFHPAYLLRDPSKKREVWEDMKKVRDELSKLK